MAKPKKDVNDNIFKIRDTETGLYSNGGTYPTFNKKGKSWSQIGHVKTHLVQFQAIPDTWEIVEIEMRPCSIRPATECFRPPTDGRDYRTKLRPELFPGYQKPQVQSGQIPMKKGILLQGQGFGQPLATQQIMVQMQNIYQVLQAQPMKGLSFNATIQKNKSVPIVQLKPVITGKIKP